MNDLDEREVSDHLIEASATLALVYYSVNFLRVDPWQEERAGLERSAVKASDCLLAYALFLSFPILPTMVPA